MSGPEFASFVAALPERLRAAAARDEVAVGLAAAIAAGEAAWPELRVAREPFAAALGQRLADVEADGLAAGMAGLDHAGLYLAHACVLGDPRALARFDARCCMTSPGSGGSVTIAGGMISPLGPHAPPKAPSPAQKRTPMSERRDRPERRVRRVALIGSRAKSRPRAPKSPKPEVADKRVFMRAA